jgi:hypothetical protein
MDIHGRFFIGIFVAFVLMGIFTYFDRVNADDCKKLAHAHGATVMDAIKLCSR